MNTMEKCVVAELLVKQRFCEKGWDVFDPVGIKPYDILVQNIDKKYYKVQIKKGTKDSKQGTLTGWTSRSNGLTCNPYSLEEVDMFAVVDIEAHKVYLVPASERIGKDGKLKRSIILRLTEPKIKSPTAIKADSYIF